MLMGVNGEWAMVNNENTSYGRLSSVVSLTLP